MKKALVPVIVTLLSVMIMFPVLSSEVSGASVNVSGSVYTLEGELEGVSVTAHEWNGLSKMGAPITATTSSTGEFTLTGLDDTKQYFLEFEKDGLGVKIAPELSDKRILSNLDVSVPYLTVVMGPASGIIIGKVTNENGDSLGGVNVQAVNAVGVVRHDVTKSDGTYSISAPTGSWTVSASRSDYKGTDISVVVGDGVSSTADFTMEKSTKTYVFGLDLPHTMMVAGLFLGLILVVIAAWYRRHVGKIIGEKPPEDVV